MQMYDWLISTYAYNNIASHVFYSIKFSKILLNFPPEKADLSKFLFLYVYFTIIKIDIKNDYNKIYHFNHF